MSAKILVDTWNDHHKHDTLVRYHGQIHTTRSKAMVHSSGKAKIWLLGMRGAVDLVDVKAYKKPFT